MKKMLKHISCVALLLSFLASCVENTPEYKNFPSKDVDFSYAVAPSASGEIEYAVDFYVVSTIQFTNTSAKTGNITWDFGDGETSTEANPAHKYAKAGTYQVKLTIDGVGSRTYPLLIADITPTLSIKEQSADTLTINDVSVDFSIFLPNPENKRVKYVWTFPDGTIDEEGNEITTFMGYADEEGNVDYPGKLRFRNVGSQQITLNTTFDLDGENRQLASSYVNVQVGADKPYKTLYYATLDGNIKALKLITDGLPEGSKNLPFDMGVSSGNMPFNLVYADVTDGGSTEGWIYILDAGKQYTYIDDSEGVNGDGKINVMRPDGSNVNTMVTNVGQTAFDDPFFGCVDGNNLLYTDRNTGIRTLALSTRGAEEGNSYFVQNSQLGYYNRGIAYGAISTSIYKSKGDVYYWGKCYNGNGIFRFKTSDIGSTDAIPYPILLNSVMLKAFTIDEARSALYVWRTKTDGGFYVYPLPAESKDGELSGSGYTTRVLMDADPINTTDSEGVYVTQMVVDSETGYVYFGFNKDSKDTSAYSTGLKYYDPSTNTVKNVTVVTDEILGITINDHKSQLF